MADDPLHMPPEEIATWLGGGAEPGSTRHEQAKAALAWRIAKVQGDASGGRRWAAIAAVGAAVIVASVVSAVANLAG